MENEELKELKDYQITLVDESNLYEYLYYWLKEQISNTEDNK